MASQFYNRYIPPSSLNSDLEEVPRPAKKRKKATSKPEHLPTEAQTQVEIPQELPSRGRHEAIFSKYEKSAVALKGDVPTGDLPTMGQEPEVTDEIHGLEPLPQPAQAESAPRVPAFSYLPDWLQNPLVVSSSDTVPLIDLPINEKTLSSLKQKGYDIAFAIQSAVLPMLLPGSQHYPNDLCISAATGSGKTLAYALPMIEALRGKPVTRLRGLIVVPTRELVTQVKETLDLCGGGSGLKFATAVGSKPLKEEQALLVQKGQRYDPEGYKAEQEREIDEEEELMDWDFEKRFGPKDDFEVYYNHVVEYTSKIDILVCTPGRLVEHIQSTTGFTLEHVQWLVIDEADRLLDESFQQWINVVLPGLEYLPPLDLIEERISNSFHSLRRRELRKIILSATMTRDVSKLAALKLKEPKLVVLEGQTHDRMQHGDEVADLEGEGRVELPATLHEIAVKVPDSNDKPLYLVRVLEAETDAAPRNAAIKPDVKSLKSDHSSDSEPSSDSSTASARKENVKPLAPSPSNTHGTLIFTKSNEHATRLARLLSLIRPDWSPKIGTLTKMSSKGGRKTLDSFRKNKLSILIASDRASRGLDIPNLAHVINYDMPSSLTSYIHRVGRTARAGKAGRATTLIADNEARWFWNEIARAENVGRGPGKKVVRDNSRYVFDEEERKMYEIALEDLGREAQG